MTSYHGGKQRIGREIAEAIYNIAGISPGRNNKKRVEKLYVVV